MFVSGYICWSFCPENISQRPKRKGCSSIRSQIYRHRDETFICVCAFKKTQDIFFEKNKHQICQLIVFVVAHHFEKQPVTTPYFPQMKSPCYACNRSSSLASWRLSEEVQSIQCSMAGRPEIVVQRVQRELQVVAGKVAAKWGAEIDVFLPSTWVPTVDTWFSFSKGRWGLVFKISRHHVSHSLFFVGSMKPICHQHHAFIERIDFLGSNLSTFQLHQKELGASVCWPILSNYILYIYNGIVTLQTNWSYGFTVRFCTLWWHFAAKRPFRRSDMIPLAQRLEISWAKTTFQVHTRMVPTTPKVLFVSLREGT